MKKIYITLHKGIQIWIFTHSLSIYTWFQKTYTIPLVANFEFAKETSEDAYKSSRFQPVSFFLWDHLMSKFYKTQPEYINYVHTSMDHECYIWKASTRSKPARYFEQFIKLEVAKIVNFDYWCFVMLPLSKT